MTNKMNGSAPLATAPSQRTASMPESVSRRRWLKGMGAMAGLTLTVGVDGIVFAQEARKYGRDGMPGGAVDDPLVFVQIGEDGRVTISRGVALTRSTVNRRWPTGVALPRTIAAANRGGPK